MNAEFVDTNVALLQNGQVIDGRMTIINPFE